jgi:His/Glu/Gln/Arg/opine family amino acid ABC transporter permease subunit
MDWATFQGHLPLLAAGAVTTLWLTLTTMLTGFLIALPVALARNAESGVARAFAVTFVFVFRGAPLLALLFMIYYGAPELPLIRDTWAWTLFREPIPCAVAALSLNSAGYLAEIIAGALRSVPRGEVEAARALGLSRLHTFRFVKVPSAVRAGLRAYGNEVVFILKGTSVASLVTVMDVMSAANQVYYATYDPFTPMLAAGAIYLAVVALMIATIRAAERRMRVPSR